MFAVVKLEQIADDFYWHEQHGNLPFVEWLYHMKRLGSDKSQSWLAKLDENGNRDYISGLADYSKANSTGSRGIFMVYLLETGAYEINERISFRKVKHYFSIVENGVLREVTKGDALKWLKNTSA